MLDAAISKIARHAIWKTPEDLATNLPGYWMVNKHAAEILELIKATG
jgi:hypothetical protein